MDDIQHRDYCRHKFPSIPYIARWVTESANPVHFPPWPGRSSSERLLLSVGRLRKPQGNTGHKVTLRPGPSPVSPIIHLLAVCDCYPYPPPGTQLEHGSNFSNLRNILDIISLSVWCEFLLPILGRLFTLRFLLPPTGCVCQSASPSSDPHNTIR